MFIDLSPFLNIYIYITLGMTAPWRIDWPLEMLSASQVEPGPGPWSTG